MISAVPSTGSSASVPGYGVWALSWVQVSRINARPPHLAIDAIRSDSRRHCWIDRATRPPAASSQARVGSEKNAHDGEVRVHSTPATNDAAPISASTTAYGTGRGVARSGRTRRTDAATAMMSSGHTR